jgi:hypothetical protein
MAKANEIRVFGMGDKGVNVQSGPLHSETGDVVLAQNVSFFGADERGGLSTRMGLRQYSAACAGAILAILPVTFADTITTIFLTDMNLDIVTDDAYIALTEG